MNVDLLEYIAAKTSNEFLSDLKLSLCCSKKSAILRCINRISPESCSLGEWNEAASYITGQSVCFISRSDAKAFILTYLGQNVN